MNALVAVEATCPRCWRVWTYHVTKGATYRAPAPPKHMRMVKGTAVWCITDPDPDCMWCRYGDAPGPNGDPLGYCPDHEALK
jgi:hypothetical protein